MSNQRTTTKATDVDRHVGARIRERRILLGMSQQQMADAIGITYQQAHKYERGINRASASRLHDIAKALKAPVGYFFDGLDQPAKADPVQRQVMDVARNFAAITDTAMRASIAAMVRTAAGANAVEA